MFKPMQKIVKIVGTNVKLQINRDAIGGLTITWQRTGLSYFPYDRDISRALGFPTEPQEEAVDEIEGVIE